MDSEEEELSRKFDILRYSKEGMTVRKISEITGIPKSTVQYVIKKKADRGTVMRVAGSGRKKSLEEEEIMILKEISLSTPTKSAKSLVQDVKEQMQKDVSYKTVQRGLKSVGLVSAVPRKLPLLSKNNISNRMIKGTQWSSWTLKQWDKVIFSDETKINLFSSDGRVKYGGSKKRETIQPIFYPLSNMVGVAL